jgi:hypothetical protein
VSDDARKRRRLARAEQDLHDAGYVVLRRDAYGELRSRAAVSYDRDMMEGHRMALMRQIEGLTAKIGRLETELREAAEWRLTGLCRACRAEQPEPTP